MSDPSNQDAPPPPPAASSPAKKKLPPRTSQGSNPDRALLALVFFIAFAAGCYFLVRELRRDAWIQECVQRGHKNCDPDMPQINDR